MNEINAYSEKVVYALLPDWIVIHWNAVRSSDASDAVLAIVAARSTDEFFFRPHAEPTFTTVLGDSTDTWQQSAVSSLAGYFFVFPDEAGNHQECIKCTLAFLDAREREERKLNMQSNINHILIAVWRGIPIWTSSLISLSASEMDGEYRIKLYAANCVGNLFSGKFRHGNCSRCECGKIHFHIHSNAPTLYKVCCQRCNVATLLDSMQFHLYD